MSTEQETKTSPGAGTLPSNSSPTHHGGTQNAPDGHSVDSVAVAGIQSAPDGHSEVVVEASGNTTAPDGHSETQDPEPRTGTQNQGVAASSGIIGAAQAAPNTTATTQQEQSDSPQKNHHP